MKTIALLLIVLSNLAVAADDGLFGQIFNDPRGAGAICLKVERGTEVERGADIARSLLIIHWGQHPVAPYDSYQISGVDGFFSQARLLDFLNAFYAEPVPDEGGAPGRALNVIVAANEWGYGSELIGKIKDLSKKHQFNVYFAGGWGFNKARLSKEPADVAERIKKAFEQSGKGEKSGK